MASLNKNFRSIKMFFLSIITMAFAYINIIDNNHIHYHSAIIFIIMAIETVFVRRRDSVVVMVNMYGFIDYSGTFSIDSMLRFQIKPKGMKVFFIFISIVIVFMYAFQLYDRMKINIKTNHCQKIISELLSWIYR